MSETSINGNTFRIEINDSQYRRVYLTAVLFMLFASVWLWNAQVIPHQLLIQSALSFVLIAWFVPQIWRKEPSRIILLKEAGDLFWLQPADDTPWKVSQKSRFNRYLHWLVVDNSWLQKQHTILVFRDSVSEDNWRHLCRIVGKK